MKKLILSLGLGVTLLFSVTSCGNPSINTSKSYEVSDFSSINLEVIGEVIYEQADSFYVDASGSSDLMEGLKVTDRNGKLSIELKNKRKFSGNKKELVIRIGSPQLESINFNSIGYLHIKNHFIGNDLTITNQGVGEIKIDDCHVNTFSLTSQSVGSIEIKGAASETIIHSEGVGQIDCSEFKSNKTIVESNGVGNISVYAKERLEVAISGIGSVKYYGNPAEVKEDISGMGKVKKM